MIFGLPATFSAMALPFAPATALPWVIVSWPIVALSGYRIWRIDHPGESAQSAVGVRVRWLASGLTTALVTALVAVLFRDPVWLVVGIIVLLLAWAAVGVLGRLVATRR